MALLSIVHNSINRLYNYSSVPVTVPHSIISLSSHPMFSIVSIFAVPWFHLSFANWVIFKASVLCFLPNISNTASVFSHASIAILVVHTFSSSFGYILVAFHISTAVSLISFVIFKTSAFVLSSFSISSNKVHIT